MISTAPKRHSNWWETPSRTQATPKGSSWHSTPPHHLSTGPAAWTSMCCLLPFVCSLHRIFVCILNIIIQYRHEPYYSGLNRVEFRDHNIVLNSLFFYLFCFFFLKFENNYPFKATTIQHFPSIHPLSTARRLITTPSLNQLIYL